jgi:hypothetical protein
MTKTPQQYSMWIGQVVRVEFLDHCSIDGWRTEDELKDSEPSLVVAYVWLVKAAPGHIVIAAIKDEGDMYHRDMCIVKGCIQNMRLVK